MKATRLNLQGFEGTDRRGVVVVGYEHTPNKISLQPLIDAFEVVVTQVAKVRIGPRIHLVESGLCHPVHQQFTVAAWEVLSNP